MAHNRSSDWDADSPDYSPSRTFAPRHHSGDSHDPAFGTHRQRRRSMRALVGLDENRPLKRHYTGAENLLWSRIRTTLQEPFAEFLGVLLLTCFYMGSIAQSLLSAGEPTAPGGYGYGTFMSVPWGTGIGVMLGIYVAGDSGAYLNPAITIANCVFRGLPWRSVPAILTAQYLGAFVGAALVYGNYVSAIDNYSGGSGLRFVPPAEKATAAIMATYPQTFVPRSSQVLSVVVPSGLVTVVVSALKDDYNNGISKAGGNFFPLAMFFLFYGIGVAFGWETGGAVNPALDFSGRIMSNIVGYPSEVWTAGGYYFWVPLLMPFVGTMVGSFVYDALVFTGPSPINSPWLGFKRFFDSETKQRNFEERKAQRHDQNTTEV